MEKRRAAPKPYTWRTTISLADSQNRHANRHDAEDQYYGLTAQANPSARQRRYAGNFQRFKIYYST